MQSSMIGHTELANRFNDSSRGGGRGRGGGVRGSDRRVDKRNGCRVKKGKMPSSDEQNDSRPKENFDFQPEEYHRAKKHLKKEGSYKEGKQSSGIG